MELRYCVFCVLLLLGSAHGEVLSSFVRHYEPLHYDSDSLMWNHNRVRRSVMGDREIDLTFSAFGRDFDLVLKPETRLFHPDFTLEFDGEKVNSYHAKGIIYSGTDRNDPSVRVHGNLAHDVFDGTIITDSELYHIEPSRRYLRNTEHHSVIYRQSDLDLSTVSGATCGSAHEEVRKEMLTMQESVIRDAESHRLKRQSATGVRDPGLKRCWLYAIADYKFVQALTATNDNPLGVMLTVILTASSIYERTDFDGDGDSDGIHFGILGMMVENQPPLNTSLFFQEFVGVQAFLNEHSTANWTRYCLSYRFTSRDFNDGVVGLAYIGAQPGVNAAGGVCEVIRTFSGNVDKTLNTGIVTVLNYGQRVPPAISALTFAHEAGHNFGSNHDPRAEPADPNGAYIMDAFSTDGSLSNNNKFSARSRAEMFPVIEEEGQDSGNGCFVRSDTLCGNNLLDDGEECDCGPDVNGAGICLDNQCCNGTSCVLNGNVDCSPDQGPCCNDSCMFVEESANMMCSMASDCAMEQTCNGTIATCPDPTPLPDDMGVDYRLCNNGTAICVNARCMGTFCVALDLLDCECANSTQACDVCCKVGGVNGTCTSTLDIAAQNISGHASQLPGGVGAIQPVGYPCLNFTGYCDFFNSCMIVDEDGALSRLANLIFNSAEFQLVIRWITTMWWAVLLIVIGLIIILFFVVLLFHFVLPRPETVKNRRQRQKNKREGIQMEKVEGKHRNVAYT